MPIDRLFEPLRDAALSAGRLRTAVAYPLCPASLGAAVQARDAGYIEPVLVGPARRIAALLAEMGVRAGELEIVDTPDDEKLAARAAAALARDGAASMLMKGSLHTDELMHEVVARTTGLRSGRRISHVFIMETSSAT
ncbi:hypothetical protein G6F32_014112 [Rhizopus arrhizus]|nr:hypothetical protein G6F32_014112 [Rhizopus arrhizus]